MYAMPSGFDLVGTVLSLFTAQQLDSTKQGGRARGQYFEYRPEVIEAYRWLNLLRSGTFQDF
jgi:hypothetical protein